MLQKTSQNKRVPGPMEKAVLRSLNAKNFEIEETWGRKLALAYAKQLDEAERAKAEVLSILDEADTGSKTWHERLLRIEKYVVAETTLNSTGPKLLALMEKLGMTPAVVKAAAPKGGKGGDDDTDPVEDELAALRGKRGAASRTA